MSRAFMAAAVALLPAGCGREKGTAPAKEPPREEAKMAIQVTSPAFQKDERMPSKHTGDGADVSPAIAWSGVPANAKALALVCDDPDAPRPGGWVHWVIYDIPATQNGLPEGIAKTGKPKEAAGAVQGKGDFGKVGYFGPAPPRGHGTHHYHFKLHALDAPTGLPEGATKKDLLKAIEGHVLATGEIVGTYSR